MNPPRSTVVPATVDAVVEIDPRRSTTTVEVLDDVERTISTEG